jgi:LuxR family transcriptional regulator, maltose regulon positive regulatory protein
VRLLGLVYLADAELACGDRPAARAALARAREVVDDEPVSAFAVRRLEEAEARLGRAGTCAAARSGALSEELTDRELSILRARKTRRPSGRSARRCSCRSTQSRRTTRVSTEN